MNFARLMQLQKIAKRANKRLLSGKNHPKKLSDLLDSERDMLLEKLSAALIPHSQSAQPCGRKPSAADFVTNPRTLHGHRQSLSGKQNGCVTFPGISSDREEPSAAQSSVASGDWVGTGVEDLKSWLIVCKLAPDMSSLAEHKFLQVISRNSKLFYKKNSELWDLGFYHYAQLREYTKSEALLAYMLSMSIEPTLATIGCLLLAADVKEQPNLKLARRAVDLCHEKDLQLNRILLAFPYSLDEEQSIRRVLVDFLKEDVQLCLLEESDFVYDNPLVNQLNHADLISPTHSSQLEISAAPAGAQPFSKEILMAAFRDQLAIEQNDVVVVKSVASDGEISKKDLKLEAYKQDWLSELKLGVHRKISVLKKTQFENTNRMNLLPFFTYLSPDELAELLLKEFINFMKLSDSYDRLAKGLSIELGRKLMESVLLKLKLKHRIDVKMEKIYSLYLDRCFFAAGSSTKVSHRELWCRSAADLGMTPHVSVPFRPWSRELLQLVGSIMLEIMMENLCVTARTSRVGTSIRTPALYSISTDATLFTGLTIRLHPNLINLVQSTNNGDLSFPATFAPMICPPLPLINRDNGGYLFQRVDLIRFDRSKTKFVSGFYAKIPHKLYYPVLDSLNQLSAVAWTVNEKVLDVMIDVFQSGGNPKLEIPEFSDCSDKMPTISPHMTPKEKYDTMKKRFALRKRNNEMYSLWSFCLYKLSFGQHYRGKLLFLPTNMDFRGRVYPIPPYSTHVGDDVSRGILKFAQGLPLGESGLSWLKLHCVNLTGTMKKSSISERRKQAEALMPKILDSAKNPLTGDKWWMESEDPWQTLGCCIEIADALSFGDPATFVSNIPVHQDGSCNGLQHYAALGRDAEGARQVNLSCSDVPQDVYVGVASRVEEKRKMQADKGDKLAKMLEGYVVRKVLKQSIMTTVYGVTMYGAKLQIVKQLRYLNFPKRHEMAAAVQLATWTFLSLGEVFRSTQLIQNWLIECATLMTRDVGITISWITPLGVPVIQPYFKPRAARANKGAKLSRDTTHDSGSVGRKTWSPDVMKQRNAFPPNYIHSLDSTHMMLTSLYSRRRNITFTSVHDCFWTHAASVADLNEICRDQFVALHQLPLLDMLSRQMVHAILEHLHVIDFYHAAAPNPIYPEPEIINSMLSTQAVKHLDSRFLNILQRVQAVPRRGNFDINAVLKSTYFFS